MGAVCHLESSFLLLCPSFCFWVLGWDLIDLILAGRWSQYPRSSWQCWIPHTRVPDRCMEVPCPAKKTEAPGVSLMDEIVWALSR
uniref:Uncharacterized protein n=1 Tax=Arundo donax TaxID=35708 RepID=A0A0A9F7M9_ARUDO